jgi:hypothetical protein
LCFQFTQASFPWLRSVEEQEELQRLILPKNPGFARKPPCLTKCLKINDWLFCKIAKSEFGGARLLLALGKGGSLRQSLTDGGAAFFAGAAQ